ncbi:hypothetical protein [Geopseudomonas aromaticivorans]
MTHTLALPEIDLFAEAQAAPPAVTLSEAELFAEVLRTQCGLTDAQAQARALALAGGPRLQIDLDLAARPPFNAADSHRRPAEMPRFEKEEDFRDAMSGLTGLLHHDMDTVRQLVEDTWISLDVPVVIVNGGPCYLTAQHNGVALYTQPVYVNERQASNGGDNPVAGVGWLFRDANGERVVSFRNKAPGFYRQDTFRAFVESLPDWSQASWSINSMEG